jgi:hypothetical protein
MNYEQERQFENLTCCLVCSFQSLLCLAQYLCIVYHVLSVIQLTPLNATSEMPDGCRIKK